VCERQKEERPEREAGGDRDRDRGDVKKEEGGRSRRRGERDDDDDDGDDGEDPAGGEEDGEEDVKVEGEGGEAEALLAKVRAAVEEAEGSELKSALEELLEAA
jgi:hypothetical protein